MNILTHFKKIYQFSKGYIKGFFVEEKIVILSEVDKLNNRLKEVFKLEEGFVLTLNGEWGIGKTYFWNSFIDKHLSEKLKNKEIAYISLFGKEKLSDIESDIIMQVSSIAKIKDYLGNSLGSLGFGGVKVSNVLSLIPKADFENIIICFDDFERKSDKLDSKDILGLISQFKEQKNCKILMIYNQDEIKEKEVISAYKDKVIDYELNYKPTVEESFNAVASKLKFFKDYLSDYLNSKGINNIRIIKRLINALNDFDFIKEEVKGHSDIEEEIVSSIMRLSAVNAQYNDFDLEVLVTYLEDKRYDQENKFQVNEKFEQILFLLDTNNDFLIISDILSNINYYIKNSIIDKTSLLAIINNRKEIKSRKEIAKKIGILYSKFNYDLTYDINSFPEEMLLILQDGGDDIVEIIYLSAFINYIEQMIEINPDGEDKYREFALAKIKVYIDSSFEKDMVYDELQSFGQLEKIKEFDKALGDYIDEKEKKINESKISSDTEIIELFKSPIRNRSWGDEPILLESIDKEVYKKYIQESPKFLREVFSFIRWTLKFSGGSGFDNAVDKMMKVLEELSEIPEYKTQIEKVLKSLKKS